jgi:nucleotide-binding universal stress UspA family protein
LKESEEMREDRAYLADTAVKLQKEGLSVDTHLALGDPPTEILKTAESAGCDLIAMTTHGHRLLADFIYGSTISKVRHLTTIPILIVRAIHTG